MGFRWGGRVIGDFGRRGSDGVGGEGANCFFGFFGAEGEAEGVAGGEGLLRKRLDWRDWCMGKGSRTVGASFSLPEVSSPDAWAERRVLRTTTFRVWTSFISPRSGS